MKRFFPYLIAFIFGAITVIGFAPFYRYLLPFVTFAVLIYLWQRTTSPRTAALLGFAFALGYFLVGVSWVYVSMHDFGYMPAPLAALATFLFCALLACFPALVGYLQSRFFSHKYSVITLPALWALSEWCRGWFLTGFPWLAVGCSQAADSPLAGYASVIGVYGVSMMTMLSAALLVYLLEFLRLKQHQKTATSVVALISVLGVGIALKQIEWTKPVGEPISVSLLQGNIPQDFKFQEERFLQTLTIYRELALSSKAKLIVMPETALPRLLELIPKDYLDSLQQHAKQRGSDMLIGVPLRDSSNNFYNSAISLGVNSPQRYDKTHLVPLGEFIPPGFGWILAILQIPLSDFSRGTASQKPLQLASQRVAINICYEDAFGEEIIQQLPEATMLINMSNVAWFGDSLAPAQHLQISQMRALETGRYMLRATNTGMTAIINQKGEITQVLPRFQQAKLEGTAQGFEGATPYIRWGNKAILLILGLILASAITSKKT